MLAWSLHQPHYMKFSVVWPCSSFSPLRSALRRKWGSSRSHLYSLICVLFASVLRTVCLIIQHETHVRVCQDSVQLTVLANFVGWLALEVAPARHQVQETSVQRNSLSFACSYWLPGSHLPNFVEKERKRNVLPLALIWKITGKVFKPVSVTCPKNDNCFSSWAQQNDIFCPEIIFDKQNRYYSPFKEDMSIFLIQFFILRYQNVLNSFKNNTKKCQCLYETVFTSFQCFATYALCLYLHTCSGILACPNRAHCVFPRIKDIPYLIYSSDHIQNI